MARGKKSEHTPVESIRHADKRANIPTEELRDFVAEDERVPMKVLYPRDPSLDPQLVWKGKDEQDSHPLEVPAVPIYVQEKIHPQALIENLRETAKAGEPEPELTLFDDFNGIAFEELVDFYQHEQNWANRMILGDSLLVMTSLAEKEGLRGQVQMIYLDPPYGIKFNSNWQVSTRKRDVKDGKAEDTTRQPEQVKAFRDTWELGIHSYLAYLRDRLVLARDLLSETGSVFVQIGDENVHLVRALMDEVFGSENFAAQIAVTKTGSLTGELLSSVVDYLVWYARDRGAIKYRKLYDPRPTRADGDFNADPLKSDGYRTGTTFDFEFDGRLFKCAADEHWKVTKEGLERLAWADRLVPLKQSLRFKRYFSDFPAQEFANVWTGFGGASDMVYVVQTNKRLVERCILMTTDPGDLVLDPTCGSGTTAVVSEEWGRRWITIDTSRVALALARTRVMASRFSFYLLRDSAGGALKEAQLAGGVPASGPHSSDVRKGFIYKRVPHVTLKSIANNPDIREGMSREQIDAVIARHPDSELLYDQPHRDSSRIRVTGPFTVESLSPHRMLEAIDEVSEFTVREGQAYTDFATMILDNLKKAGVQNTRRDERLEFDRIEPYPAEWVNAVGEYVDSSGAVRRVAISIGPEHGTVGSEQVKEAAKEALRGVGFDLLIILGFAFDAHAGDTASEISPAADSSEAFAAAESTRKYGKLQVMLARMNPDLAMGEDLLKKTGAGNLFTVFGEPDVEVRTDSDGKLVAEVKGVDVYDPTTGVVRSDSTDDIACWFIDTDYNGESFFVRHAYFTGADDPYAKLKRALRAEIDEVAWASLYSTVSRPFDRPSTGQIAIKVINHYGDEVMKVYAV